MSGDTVAHTTQRIIVPRYSIDTLLARYEGTTRVPALAVGYAHVDERGGDKNIWCPNLHSANPSVRPEQLPETAGASADGVLVLSVEGAAASAEVPPDDWEAWVERFASAYRLHTAKVAPQLYAVRLFSDGVYRAVALAQHGGRWQATLCALDLPGTEMLRLPPSSSSAALGAATLTSAGALPTFDDDAQATGRYSRAGGAMGWPALVTLQDSVVAIVGVGRIGSTLAHSLVRLGVSVVLVDPDHVEPHNCDGDVLPVHEGLSKTDAVARFLRSVRRPGARLESVRMSIASNAARAVIRDADVVISAVDNHVARHRVSTLAIEYVKPHLDIGTLIEPSGAAEADIRLLVPGDGCLHCIGGLGAVDELTNALNAEQRARRMLRFGMTAEVASVDFRAQRVGSSRSWGMVAGHFGLRLLEKMVRGTVRRSVHYRLRDDADGDLTVERGGLVPGPRCQWCEAT